MAERKYDFVLDCNKCKQMFAFDSREEREAALAHHQSHRDRVQMFRQARL